MVVHQLVVFDQGLSAKFQRIGKSLPAPMSLQGELGFPKIGKHFNPEEIIDQPPKITK